MNITILAKMMLPMLLSRVRSMLSSMLFLAVSFSFFSFAIRQTKTSRRYILGCLHLLSIVWIFWTEQLGLLAYLPMAVPFIIGLTVHSASVVFCGKQGDALPSLGMRKQLKAAWSLYTDIRGLGSAANGRSTGIRSRLVFTAWKASAILSLWCINWLVLTQLPTMLLPNGMSLEDLSPQNQGILPTSQHAMAVRSLMTISWIWSTYYNLNLPHSILSITFVTILRFDQPEDWPPLFGNFWQATSVQRFWGGFWQKLHVRPFEALMPMQHKSKPTRAFGMFLMSAGCHALADFALYGENTMPAHVWFFMYNFAVCAAEVKLLKVIKARSVLRSKSARIAGLVLGYGWTFLFFSSATPGWQYPLILSTMKRNMEMADNDGMI